MTRENKIRLLLLGAILLVFGQVVTHDFVDWDDGLQLYHNPIIVDHTLSGLAKYWNPFSDENSAISIYCPMVFTVWWGLAHLSNVQSPDIFFTTLNPYIYHAANLAMHWVCACLVFEILLRLKIRPWPAGCGTLIFALHPLQTEAVAWASAMKDLLSGFFALLTILMYIIALDSQGSARKRNYGLSTIFFIAALLSKPSTVVLPAIAGVIDRMMYGGSWKQIARWTWYWYAMGIVIVLITARVQKLETWVGGPLWAHPLIAMDSLAFYLGKLMLPLHLRFDYGRSPQALFTDPALHHALYWTWIFPALLALALWRTKRKVLILSAAIFALGLLPVLGLKTFAFQYYTTVADRYVYLPMLGVALAVGWFIQQHGSRAVAIATAAIICILASLSFVQAREWTDTPTLFSYALDKTRPLHLTTLAQYQDALAEPYFHRAQIAAAAGDYTQQRTCQEQGNAYVEKAIVYYRLANRLGPLNGETYNYLARDLVVLGRLSEAIDTVKRWIDADPHEEFGIRQKPGRLQDMLGMLYLQNHQYQPAVQAFQQSLSEQDDPQVRSDLARANALAAKSSATPARPTTSQ
jgi:tetratricopeptide (TPR) repeat protein